MFAFFIYSIIFNSLNTRSERFNVFEHIEENKNFIIVMGVIFILQTIIIEMVVRYSAQRHECKSIICFHAVSSAHYPG